MNMIDTAEFLMDHAQFTRWLKRFTMESFDYADAIEIDHAEALKMDKKLRRPTVSRVKRERKITFTNVGVEQGSRVWRNRETGVEIIKGKNFAEVGLYYVCVPAAPISMCGPAGRRIMGQQASLEMARSQAVGHVMVMRREIAQAYTEACTENANRGYDERLSIQARGTHAAFQQIEQIKGWLARHGIELITAKNVLTAHQIDHAEALDVNDKLNEEALEVSIVGKTLGDLPGEVPGGLCVRDAAGMQWVTMNPIESEPREPGHVLFTSRKPMLRLDVQHWRIIADYRPSRHWCQ